MNRFIDELQVKLLVLPFGLALLLLLYVWDKG